MSRPITDLKPEEVPDGVRIRSFRPDEEALLEVNAHAFAHHPEQGHMTWTTSTSGSTRPGSTPTGCSSPSPGGPVPSAPTLLGFHWTKVHRDENPPYGEVYVVATNPKAAGRGLGNVLTNVGLRHLRDRGVDNVILYVDGDNDAGRSRSTTDRASTVSAPRCSTAAPPGGCTTPDSRTAPQASAWRSMSAISRRWPGPRGRRRRC